MGAQAGFLEPISVPESGAGGPFTIEGLFGKAAPDPLVMSAGPAGNYLEIGGYDYVVAPMSGVQTVDVGGPTHPDLHAPHARNLLRPMHSESFWILVLAGLALVVVGTGKTLKLGPVTVKGGIGR